MQHIRITALLLATALLPAGMAAHAHTAPQWSRSVMQSERRDDPVIVRNSWASTADGGSVVGSAAKLWRFQADGTLRFVNTLPGLQAFGYGGTLIVMRDEAASATYIAANTFEQQAPTASCVVVRVGDNGLQQWVVEAAGPGAGACTALAVAADGSAIVARERALARVDRTGQVLWSRNDLTTRNVAIGPLLLIDEQSRIVTPRYDGSQAHLARYGLDGAPLADIALPASAQPATIHGLDLLPNGDVAVAGREDLTGVLYLLAPAHTLRLLQRSADALPYTRTVSDGATIYVQAGDTQPPGAEQVRAIDALSGGLRWQLPAKEVVAARAGGGVSIVQRPIQPEPAPMQLVGLGSDGNGQWAQPLPLGSSDAVHGGRDATGNPRVLALPQQGTQDCGRALTMLALAAEGTTQARHAACAAEVFKPLTALQADAGGGALLQTQGGVLAVTASNGTRWSLFDCPYCAAQEQTRLVSAATLLADGGAWLIVHDRTASISSIERRDPAGGLVTSVPLPAGFATQGAPLVNADSAQLVGSIGNTVRLFTVTATGATQLGPEISVPAPTVLGASRAQRLAGGDFAVEIRRTACAFLCPQQEATLLRLAPDGSERWRFQGLVYSNGAVRWNDDGSALLLNRYPTQNLRRIDAQGVATAEQPLNFALDQVIGPSQGRWLARDADGALFLGDAQGGFVAATAPHAVSRLITAGSEGFLVDAAAVGADTALLEPQQLGVRATFDAPGVIVHDDYFAGSSQGQWRLLDDGSVYGETFVPLPAESSLATYRVRVSRFAVPGSAASDLVFADAFD